MTNPMKQKPSRSEEQSGLLSCPFCGGQAGAAIIQQGGLLVAFVECSQCGTRGPTFGCSAKYPPALPPEWNLEDTLRDRACTLWNARARDSAYKHLYYKALGVLHRAENTIMDYEDKRWLRFEVDMMSDEAMKWLAEEREQI